MNTRPSSIVTIPAIIGLLTLGFASPAQATTISSQLSKIDAYIQIAAELAATAASIVSPKVEAENIQLIINQYKREQQLVGLNAIGEVDFLGVPPVSLFPTGTSGFVTFLFIDPGTGLPTFGPNVSSVLYEVGPDPFSLQFLGTSFDSSSNFAFPFTIPVFEPFIQATPFDAFGSPIIINGVDGQNAATGFLVNVSQVPEPSTLALFGIAVVICLVWNALGSRGPACMSAE